MFRLILLSKLLILFSFLKGRTSIDLGTAVKTLCHVLIKRRKQLSQQRLLAFLKRCMQLSLHQLHNGSISLLGVIRAVMQQVSFMKLHKTRGINIHNF